MISQIKLLLRLRKILSNWYLIIPDFLGYQTKDYSIKFRDGTKLMVSPNDHAYRVIDEIWCKNAFSDYNFKENDLIVDVGGYIGESAIYFSRFTKNKIYVLEPVKKNYNKILINIQMNNLRNIIPFNLAMTADGRDVDMAIRTDDLISSHITDKSGKIKSITLQKFIRENNISKIDLLKLDVEGSEYEIIMGLDNSDFDKINNIMMEIHKSDIYSREELINFIRDKGYTITCNSDKNDILAIKE